MKQSITNASVCQVELLRKNFVQADGLPFSDLLTSTDLGMLERQKTGVIYTPIVTLSMFLSQVISGSSCREAVARLVAQRCASREPACSAFDGAYCKARTKLDENLLSSLVRRTGSKLHDRARESWRWKSRNVKLVDGTTLTAPDTAANQREFPQPDGQKPGLGFPMIRAVALLSLAVGTLLDIAISPYSGKGTGEVSLLRQLFRSLVPGDLLVGDKIYCSYPEIAALFARGVDFVVPRNASRKTDYRQGRRLGKKDHLISWTKPRTRPDRLSKEEWDALPETLTLRELEIVLQRKGFRSKKMTVVTTLLDSLKYSVAELGELYAMRWEVELDMRSIKSSMNMGALRCRTPDMVRREIQVHLLAYNLIRGHMAEAADRSQALPRNMSFTGAMQTLRAFAEGLRQMSSPSEFLVHYESMLRVIACHQVGNRPGRQEPRKLKQRKKYDSLTIPRKEARKKIKKLQPV